MVFLSINKKIELLKYYILKYNMNIKRAFVHLILLHYVIGFPLKKVNNKLNIGRFNKKIRVNSRLFLRRSWQDIKREDSEIINTFKTIAKDDISNDILYYLKFYHLTNDNINAYIYIVFYETFNLILQNKDKKVYLPILLNNIIIYMSFKIIILQHILHHKL